VIETERQEPSPRVQAERHMKIEITEPDMPDTVQLTGVPSQLFESTQPLKYSS